MTAERHSGTLLNDSLGRHVILPIFLKGCLVTFDCRTLAFMQIARSAEDGVGAAEHPSFSSDSEVCIAKMQAVLIAKTPTSSEKTPTLPEKTSKPTKHPKPLLSANPVSSGDFEADKQYPKSNPVSTHVFSMQTSILS